MFGEPPDVVGCCNARLFMGDNYGDNSSTYVCRQPPHHGGDHLEQIAKYNGNIVTVRWSQDERKKCTHGEHYRHEHHQDGVECALSALSHDYETCPICCAARAERAADAP